MPDVVETTDPPETVETDPETGEGSQTVADGDTETKPVDDDSDDSQSTTKEADSSDKDTKADTGEGDEDKDGTSEKKTAYSELLAKYDGDEEALAEGVWNQGNSLAEINKRLQGVEENLKQALAPPPVDVQAIVDDDPYVKEAAANLRSTDTLAKEAQQEQVQIVARHGKMEKKVASLEGELKRATPEDRDEVKDDLREAKADRNEAARDYKDSKRKIAEINKELRGYAQDFRTAETKAKDLLERSQQQTQTKNEQQISLRADFTDAVAKEADKFGIPLDSQTFKVLHQSIRDRIAGYLRTFPKGAPGINTEEAVEVLMEEYVEAMGLKTRFQRSSKAKRETTKTTKASGITAPDLSGDIKGPWTADYVRKRAAQLLP
jgi:hypothetical protein